MSGAQIVPLREQNPPLANQEAEAALIGAVLFDNRLFDSVAAIVSAEHFSEPVHQRLFAAIGSQLAQGQRVTAITLKPYFEADEALKDFGGIAYLARLNAMSSAILSARETAQHIALLARRRAIREGLGAALQTCIDLESTTNDIVAHVDAAFDLSRSDNVNLIGACDAIGEMIDRFGEVQYGVKCHSIPALDQLLGPLRPKSLTICAARPGIGKTATGLSYAIGAARAGHSVLLVSLEMSSAELAARMAADLCFEDGIQVPYAFIRDGNLSDWQLRQVRDAHAEMAELSLDIADAGSLTIPRLNHIVRRQKRKMEALGKKLNLVIVDYLQLLRPADKFRSAYEATSEVSRSLKELAKDNDIAVLALAQLSREVEKRADKRPVLSDLRDSGSIEQDADTVLFLTRQEYYERQCEPSMNDPKRIEWERRLELVKNEIEFIVAKRRHGTIGSAKGQFHGAYQAVRG